MARSMQRCSNDCGFLVHTNLDMGSYCCKKCHHSPSQHGDKCQRRHAGPECLPGATVGPRQPLAKKGVVRRAASTNIDSMANNTADTSAIVGDPVRAYWLKQRNGHDAYIVMCDDEKQPCFQRANSAAKQICCDWCAVLTDLDCTIDSGSGSDACFPPELLAHIRRVDRGMGRHYKFSYVGGLAAVGMGSTKLKRERALYLALAMAKSLDMLKKYLQNDMPTICLLQDSSLDQKVQATEVKSSGLDAADTDATLEPSSSSSTVCTSEGRGTVESGAACKADASSGVVSFLDSIRKDFGKSFGLGEILEMQCGFSIENDLLDAAHDDFKPLLEHKIPPFVLKKFGEALASRRRDGKNPLLSPDANSGTAESRGSAKAGTVDCSGKEGERRQNEEQKREQDEEDRAKEEECMSDDESADVDEQDAVAEDRIEVSNVEESIAGIPVKPPPPWHSSKKRSREPSVSGHMLRPTPKTRPRPSPTNFQQAASSAAVQYILQQEERPLKTILLKFQSSDRFEVTAEFGEQQAERELPGMVQLLRPTPPRVPPPRHLLGSRDDTKIQIADVDDIYFTQESCGALVHSDEGGISTDELVRRLNAGECDPLQDNFWQLEAIEIKADPPKYMSVDNRRLCCLKAHKEHTGRDVKVRLSIVGEMRSEEDYRRALAHADIRARHHEIRQRMPSSGSWQTNKQLPWNRGSRWS